MMWNTKYGMGGGFGHMGFGCATAAMSVTPQRATEIAERWLDSRGSGYSAGTADAFYGYYTLHFEKDSQIDGMLSVHGTTGELWFHSWHGKFIQSRELGVCRGGRRQMNLAGHSQYAVLDLGETHAPAGRSQPLPWQGSPSDTGGLGLALLLVLTLDAIFAGTDPR